MSNRTDRPAGQQPAPSTDRPTATYPTADHLAHLEREEAAHRERLNDLWADATPTEELPVARPARFVRTNGPSRHGARIKHEQASPQPALCQDMQTPLCQDMWRPRWLPAWHPSFMQLAIGAALVLALLGACNVAAIQAHRTARAHCHALVVSNWQAATRECRGTGSGTPVPEQIPTSPHTSASTPAQASQATSPTPSPSALTRVTSPSPNASRPSPSTAPASPSSRPAWTVHGTGAPYSKDDPSASPLDLPACTTSPDTPMPCLASLSPDGSRAVVLEEDSSLTGLMRR